MTNFKYDNYDPPNFDSKKWEKLIRIKLCQGDELEVLKVIKSKYVQWGVLDFKTRTILGKTQFNDQLAHWTKEYISQACYMCQQVGDYEHASLIHTLFKCPKAQITVKYKCNELTKQININTYEIILTNSKYTDKIGTNTNEMENTETVLS